MGRRHFLTSPIKRWHVPQCFPAPRENMVLPQGVNTGAAALRCLSWPKKVKEDALNN